MSFAEFQLALSRDAAPPVDVSRALHALWHDARSDWERAHTCAQEEPGRDGAWVHAYLHRKEGDFANADHWYARAGRKMPPASVTLDAEWAEIARALLGEN